MAAGGVKGEEEFPNGAPEAMTLIMDKPGADAVPAEPASVDFVAAGAVTMGGSVERAAELCPAELSKEDVVAVDLVFPSDVAAVTVCFGGTTTVGPFDGAGAADAKIEARPRILSMMENFILVEVGSKSAMVESKNTEDWGVSRVYNL